MRIAEFPQDIGKQDGIPYVKTYTSMGGKTKKSESFTGYWKDYKGENLIR